VRITSDGDNTTSTTTIISTSVVPFMELHRMMEYIMRHMASPYHALYCIRVVSSSRRNPSCNVDLSPAKSCGLFCTILDQICAWSRHKTSLYFIHRQDCGDTKARVGLTVDFNVYHFQAYTIASPLISKIPTCTFDVHRRKLPVDAHII
jgi:hypothetical protein